MVAYRYWRFQQTEMRATVDTVQMSEFWYLNGGSPLTPATITGVGDNYSAGEGPENLDDNLTSTKWCNTNGLVGYFVYDFGSTVIVDGYRWATANDAPERDPVSWTIEGSDDNSTWTLVDTVTGFTGTTTREVYNPDFSFSGGGDTGALAGSIPMPSGALAGTVRGTGALAGVVPVPTGALTGTETATGALAGSAPMPTGQLTGDVETTTGLPSDVAGLVSWFKADAITGLVDGARVATWVDSSATGNAATQASNPARPLYKTGIVNGLPVVRFADTSDLLSVASPGTYETTTIFAVIRPPSTSGDYAMRRGVNSGDIEWRVTGGKLGMDRRAIATVLTGSTTLSTTNFTIATVRSDHALNEHGFYVNGTADGSVSGGNNPTPDGAYDIGIENTSGNFDIAELIVYNVVLSDSDRAAIHSYLSDKYAITVSDYVSSGDTGVLAGTVPMPVGALTGTETATAALAGVAPVPTGALSSTSEVTGALAAVAPLSAGSLAGDVVNAGSLAVAAPSPPGTLAGAVTAAGGLAGSTPLPVGALTSSSVVTGSLAGAAPMPSGALGGDVIDAGALAGSAPLPSGALTTSSVTVGSLAGTAPLPFTGSDLYDPVYGEYYGRTDPLAGDVIAAGALASVAPLPVGALTTSSVTAGSLAGAAPMPSGTLAGDVIVAGALVGAAALPSGALTGTETQTGSLAGTVPMPHGTLTSSNVTVGTLAGTIPLPAGALTGGVADTGAAAGTIPPPSGTLVGDVAATAALAGTLPTPSADFTADTVDAGLLAGTIPLPGGVFGGDGATLLGALASTVPAPVGTLSGSVQGAGTLAGATPLLAGGIAGAVVMAAALAGAAPIPTAELNRAPVVHYPLRPGAITDNVVRYSLRPGAVIDNTTRYRAGELS